MYNIITFIFAYFIFVFIHEGIHIVTAIYYNEYQTFIFKIFGPEVIYKTPVFDREGIKWGFISGLPNIITIITGYGLFFLRKTLYHTPKFLKTLFFYLIVFFLLFDAFNLSIGPLIYGGDIGGIVTGFGISKILIQAVFFIILLFNREIIIKYVFTDYQVKTNHFLFKPIIKK